ncbi:fucose-binding lectin II [Photorhabdus khanii]
MVQNNYNDSIVVLNWPLLQIANFLLNKITAMHIHLYT